MAENFRSPRKVARRLMLAPLAARHVRNWMSFIGNYALGTVPASPYVFRNGARLQIGRGVDHVPIIEVFMRRDYGPVPDNAAILDLGANIGTFSVYAASTARNVRIFAYEPVPEFLALLSRNVELNGLGKTISCVNAAVAGTAGRRDLAIQGDGLFFPTLHPANGAARRTLSVPCTTLEAILDAHRLAKVDLLKIDCEGAEYEILYDTAPDVLRRIADIRLEYHALPNERHDVEGLKEFLKAQNYAIAFDRPTSGTGGNLWARRND